MMMSMISLYAGYDFEVYKLDTILMDPLGLGVTPLMDRRFDISLCLVIRQFCSPDLQLIGFETTFEVEVSP